MRHAPFLLAGSLGLIAGCTAPRAEAPAAAVPAPAPIQAPAMIALPVDMMGTWTDSAGGGFIAIGIRQVVIAIDGSPRLVAIPTENAIEAGMSAGKIGLSGGTALFIARGRTQLGDIPVEHLDVEVVSPDGHAQRRRLLSEAGLRMAALVRPAPAPVPAPTAPSVAAAPAKPDDAFIAAVPVSRRELATYLVARAQAGAPAGDLATIVSNRQRLAYAAILCVIERSRNVDRIQASDHLHEADRKRADAERFVQAWRSWMTGRNDG